MSAEIVVPIVLCLLVAAAAYRLVPDNRHKNLYIASMLLAILIRIALVVYLYYDRADSFGTDGLLYHQEGIKIAEQLAAGIPFYSVDYSYTWYTVFIGIIYYLFGINRYIVSYINIAFSFMSAMLLFKIALYQKKRFELASLISLIFLFFPNLILWTSDSRKESPIILICFVIWYSILRFIKELTEKRSVTASNIARILFVCFLMWFGTLFRIYIFVPLAIGIIVVQLELYRKFHMKLCIIFAVIVLISSVLILTTTVMPSLDTYHAVTFENNKADTITAIASNRNILLSVINYILLPYPGDINIADIRGNEFIEFIVSLDIIVWYTCIIFIIPGIVAMFRKRNGFFMGLLAFMATYIIINALVVENVADTIYRYRSIIVGISLLFMDPDAVKRLFERSHSIKDQSLHISKGN